MVGEAGPALAGVDVLDIANTVIQSKEVKFWYSRKWVIEGGD